MSDRIEPGDGTRQRREEAVPGYASGVEAPRQATADALERAQGARSIVLVEGLSDQIAVEALAGVLGRDLAAIGIAVIPTGGVHAVGRFLRRFGRAGEGLRIGGLCDAAEEGYLRRALAQAGHAWPLTRAALEDEGFFVCERDLEDELLRAAGPEAVEVLLAAEGDLGAFRTLQRQAAWRDAPVADQMRRFLGAGARRKLRYAGLLVRALPPGRQPGPLTAVLERA